MAESDKKYILEEITQDEFEFMYAPNKKDINRGCVGYLRGDFGQGEEFYSSWFNEDDTLKTNEFKQEFEKLVNYFRETEPTPLLKSRIEMENALYLINSTEYHHDRNIKGLKVVAEKHTYYLRCFPQLGDYNFYIYCYSSSVLNKYIAEQK